MTRKDYKAIAQVITQVDMDLVKELSRVFKQDNTRFDYDKFKEACFDARTTK